MKIKPNFKKIISVLSVLLWMTMIYSFSTQNGEQSGDLSGGFIRWIAGVFKSDFESLSPSEQGAIVSSWQFFVRKAAHFSEYAVLGMLTANAVRFFTSKMALKCFVPMVISALYAVSDEIHQYFVPDRACSVKDMVLDTCGAVFGVFIFMLFGWVITKISARRKIKKKNES